MFWLWLDMKTRLHRWQGAQQPAEPTGQSNEPEQRQTTFIRTPQVASCLSSRCPS